MSFSTQVAADIIADLMYGVLEENELINSENIFTGVSNDYVIEIKAFPIPKED